MPISPDAAHFHAIYDAAFKADGWEDALEGFTEITGAKAALLHAVETVGEMRFGAGAVNRSQLPLVPEYEEYTRRFIKTGTTGYDDVGARYMHAATPYTPVLDTDIWDLDFLEAREEVIFARERTGIFRKLYYNLSTTPYLMSTLLLHYDEKLADVPAADLPAGAVLAPHLGKAVEMNRFSSELRRRYNAVLGYLDNILLGVCLVARSGEIAFSNRTSEDIFARHDTVWKRHDGRLTCADSEASLRLSSAIGRISATAAGENDEASASLSIARRTQGGPLLLIVSPLRDPDREISRAFSGCFVTMVDTAASAPMRLDAFAEAHALSPAETRVVGEALSGSSANVIAEILGKSVETVRSQLRTAYAKTGAGSRAELLWALYRYAPPVI